MTSCKIKEQLDSDKLKELFTIALFLISYVVNIGTLTLAAFALACLIVSFADYKKSLYYLAFFTSFAGIFVYSGRHMFFVIVGLFLVKSLLQSKVTLSAFGFYVVIVLYSLIFSDYQGEFKFAKIIGLILLFAIPVVAYASNKIDCRGFMQHYIFGFFVSTVIGFFAESIPAMYKLFDVTLLWTDNYLELTRFFGLAFDANFYALSNYIVLAYLLFCFNDLTVFRGLLTLFLMISGALTISKSYFLVVGIILAFYVIKNLSKVKRVAGFVLVAIVGIALFSLVSNKLGYNAIDMVLSRFIQGATFADNTTGRVDIWIKYFNIFKSASVKQFIFGFGFNAEVKAAAHNTFLEFFYHYGVIGSGIWLAFFVYCFKVFRRNVINFEKQSAMLLIALLAGTFFLSAYTYEAFWLGIVISFMACGNLRLGGDSNEVQCDSINL